MSVPQLRQALLDLPPLPPVRRQAGRGWDWRRGQIRLRLLNSNPESFLRWPIVVGAMVPQDQACLQELAWLESLSDWEERWQPALQELPFGNPERLPDPYAWTSGALVAQAYHLACWEQSSGREVGELESILEVGGGYGAMARICYALGFDGVYQIADLPELCLLQQYYLSQLGAREGFFDLDGMCWDITPKSSDLLIACYSLSEMPVRDRAAYLQCGHAHRLLAVQDFFDGVYNLDWWDRLEYPGREEDRPMSHPFRPGLFHIVDSPLSDS